MRSTVPAGGFLLTFMWATTSRPASTRSTSSSTLPPVGFSPNRRAFTTCVSLNTSRSPARSRVRQLAEHAVDRGGPVPSSRREPLRCGGGLLGDEVGGRAKSKSPRVNWRMRLRAGQARSKQEGRIVPCPTTRRSSPDRRPPQGPLPRGGRRIAPKAAVCPAQAGPRARHRPGAAPPLRYEDETRIVEAARRARGDTAQIEATVTDARCSSARAASWW